MPKDPVATTCSIAEMALSNLGLVPKKCILNLCIKTKPVTAKVDATVTVWLLFTYSISGTETGHKMLQLLR